MRVLIVDDEAAIRELLARWLSSAGFQIAGAGDVTGALEIAGGGDVGVALVDPRADHER